MHPAGATFSGGDGVYQLTGSDDDVTSELDALTLNAPSSLTGAVNNVEALTFSLSDKSQRRVGGRDGNGHHRHCRAEFHQDLRL